MIYDHSSAYNHSFERGLNDQLLCSHVLSGLKGGFLPPPDRLIPYDRVSRFLRFCARYVRFANFVFQKKFQYFSKAIPSLVVRPFSHPPSGPGGSASLGSSGMALRHAGPGEGPRLPGPGVAPRAAHGSLSAQRLLEGCGSRGGSAGGYLIAGYLSPRGSAPGTLGKGVHSDSIRIPFGAPGPEALDFVFVVKTNEIRNHRQSPSVTVSHRQSSFLHEVPPCRVPGPRAFPPTGPPSGLLPPSEALAPEPL